MPSNGPAILHFPTPTLDIVTNEQLIDRPDSSYIISGKIFRDGVNNDGGAQIAFTVPKQNLAVMVSHSLKETFSKGDGGHEPINYVSRGEVQGDIKREDGAIPLSNEYRLVRIMPVLTIKQGNKEVMHFTLRGSGASDAGNWGCASSLATGKVDTNAIFATLNRETGLLVDGKIAVFAPSEDNLNSTKIAVDAQAVKKSLGGKSDALKSAFDRNATQVVINTKMDLPKNADTVSFYDAFESEIKCIAYDNPEQKTLTLVVPMIAEFAKNAVLTPFNGQGYDGPVVLMNAQTMKKQPGVTLIPGLRELVK